MFSAVILVLTLIAIPNIIMAIWFLYEEGKE